MADKNQTGVERRTFLQATGVAGTATALGGVASAESEGAATKSYVVGTTAATTMSTAEARVAEAAPADATVTGREERLGFLTLEVPNTASTMSSDDVIEQLEAKPGVEYAELDVEFEMHEGAASQQVDGLYDPDDPRLEDQYAPQQVRAPTAWDTTLGSDDVTIAIVDQGVKYDHPDLQGRFGEVKGKDFVDDDGDPYPDSMSNEYHGTHVAGIASATTDNATGVAGVSDSRLLSCRALGESGSGSLSDIAAAIRWATDEGADVINMSLGGGGYTSTMKNAVSYAVNNGTLPICSAGNSGLEGVAYPSKYDECVSVGALDANEDRANFSQYGEDLDIVGPGVNVLSTWTDSPYERISGTSMSCPAVTGVAALGLAAADGDLTPTDLRAKLKETARDVGLSENRGGAGCANAAALVDVVGGTENEPPTASIEQSSTTVKVDTEVEFDGSGSSDPDGQIANYEWAFGDDTTATGQTATHAYDSAGDYDVTLTVTDDDGASTTDTVTITVEPTNEAPTVAIEQSSATVHVDTDVEFDGSASSDPDGSIASYEWAFGDGTTATGETATHAYDSADDYDVTLTVTDDDGASTTDSVTVTVEPPNEAPTATLDLSTTTAHVGTEIAFDGSASTDPDGDVASYAWTFGDDTTATGETATHAYDSAGDYDVTLTVTDDDGATANASTSVTIEPPNEAPTVAIDQSTATVPVGTTVEFDGSASSDPDGEIASYEWTFGDGTTATGETATHAYDSAGDYDVTLTVTDDDGASTSDAVTVTVEQTNDAPTATIEQSASEVAVGDTVEFDGSASSDPDGSIASYEWTFGDGTTATGEAATHAYGSAGDYDVTLTVTDDDGATASASASVTVQASEDPCGVTETSSAEGELGGWWDEDTYVYESELESTCQTTIAIDGPDDADFDLYVTLDGSPPSSWWDADRRSLSYGSQESIIVEGDITELGVLVDSYRGSGSYTITAEEVGGTGDGDDGNDEGSAPGAVEEGVYQLENANSGKLVDVSNISHEPGWNVHQWGDWNDPGNQQWAVEVVGDGEYRLTAQHSDLVLGLENDATDGGTSLVQQEWRDDATQRWTFETFDDGTYALENVGSGLVADVEGGGTDNGDDIIAWDAHGGDNQRWTLERVGDV